MSYQVPVDLDEAWKSHRGLFYAALKMIRVQFPKLLYDDFDDISNDAIIQLKKSNCVERYDLRISKFSTYFYACSYHALKDCAELYLKKFRCRDVALLSEIDLIDYRLSIYDRALHEMLDNSICDDIFFNQIVEKLKSYFRKRVNTSSLGEDFFRDFGGILDDLLQGNTLSEIGQKKGYSISLISYHLRALQQVLCKFDPEYFAVYLK